MVDAAHAEDEGRAEGGRETGPYAGRVGFLVKPHNCLNCQACVEACRKFNKTPESRPARRHITKYEKDGEADVYKRQAFDTALLDTLRRWDISAHVSTVPRSSSSMRMRASRRLRL